MLQFRDGESILYIIFAPIFLNLCKAGQGVRPIPVIKLANTHERVGLCPRALVILAEKDFFGVNKDLTNALPLDGQISEM